MQLTRVQTLTNLYSRIAVAPLLNKVAKRQRVGAFDYAQD